VLNNAAIMAETSSAPAASTPDVGVMATPFAALSEEAIFAKSDAAAATYSGAAITHAIHNLRCPRRSPGQHRIGRDAIVS
jgi:hypothetical protein